MPYSGVLPYMKKLLLFSAIPVLAIAIAPAIAKTEHTKAAFTSNVAAESALCPSIELLLAAARESAVRFGTYTPADR